MAQHDRERENRRRTSRERNRGDERANQGPWWRGSGPNRDYGKDHGPFALPEFRDPSVRAQPYEQEMNRNKEYGYGSTKGFGPYSGLGPKGYQRSDDRVFEEVCERLTQHGRIDARQINVAVKNGEVTLTGSVDSRQVKRMAEMTVESVEGVKDIHNQLRVEERDRQRKSGMPGGGSGRVDRVGRSGIYPASGPIPDTGAEARGMASWGQGERGSAGYEDSGSSEQHISDEDRENQEQGD